MQDNHESSNTASADETEEKRLKAEAKVEALFAQARASKHSPKPDKSPLSPSDTTTNPKTSEEKIEEIFAQARTSQKSPERENSGSFAVSADDSPKSAEEKVAEMFAQASTSNHHGKAKSFNLSATGTEVMILEFISLFIFFMCMNSPMFEVFSLFAVMMPPIVGIASRVFRYGLTISEAVSKCKLHIFVAVLFFILIFLTVV